MKQKYSILNDKATGKLIIKEYAELDKEHFSLIFEESYDAQEIEASVKNGKDELISVLRTPNLYPIAEYADKIAEEVILLIKGKSKADEPIELIFNDIDLMKKNEKKPTEAENDDAVEIDKLLDDDKAPEKEEKNKK
ncbi:MAG: hypothetical protein ACKVE4_10635 [Dissulfuribacterales bacterium]